MDRGQEATAAEVWTRYSIDAVTDAGWFMVQISFAGQLSGGLVEITPEGIRIFGDPNSHSFVQGDAAQHVCKVWDRPCKSEDAGISYLFKGQVASDLQQRLHGISFEKVGRGDSIHQRPKIFSLTTQDQVTLQKTMTLSMQNLLQMTMHQRTRKVVILKAKKSRIQNKKKKKKSSRRLQGHGSQNRSMTMRFMSDTRHRGAFMLWLTKEELICDVDEAYLRAMSALVRSRVLCTQHAKRA